MRKNFTTKPQNSFQNYLQKSFFSFVLLWVLSNSPLPLPYIIRHGEVATFNGWSYLTKTRIEVCFTSPQDTYIYLDERSKKKSFAKILLLDEY